VLGGAWFLGGQQEDFRVRLAAADVVAIGDGIKVEFIR
jgi:hypothetical protein